MLGKKLKGLFWNEGDDGVAPVPEPAPAPRTASASPVRAPRVDPPIDPARAAEPARDFTALYTRVGAVVDPRVDQVLAAYEAMRGAIAGPELAIAIGATARAIGVEPTAVANALGHRLTALDTVLADEDKKTATRETARNTELETATASATAEIAALEQKVQTLKQQLATATSQIKEKNAKERAAVVALTQQVNAEAARLRAIRDFFATPSPSR
ncbi:MAG: hypothetical protein K8W52_18360 [Deltaproteobacteria bacterium]|nr:hypothetical protein [Deltaproteobacteria bacterium]